MQSDEKYSQYWKNNIKSDESGKFTDPDLESGYQTYATTRDQINEAKSPNKLKALNETIYQDYNPRANPDYKPPEPDDVAGDPVKTQGKSIDPHLSRGGIEQNDQMASLLWMKRLLSTDDLSAKAKSGRTTPYWKAVLDKYGERYDSELGAMDDPKAFWTPERIKSMDELNIGEDIPDVIRQDDGLDFYSEKNIDSLAGALGLRPSLLRKYLVNARDKSKLGIPLYEGYINEPISPFAPWSVDTKGVPLNSEWYNLLANAAKNATGRKNAFLEAAIQMYPDKNNLYLLRLARWLRNNSLDENGKYRVQAPYVPSETPAPKPKTLRAKAKKEEGSPAPEATPENGDKPSEEEKPKEASKEKPKRIENRGVRAARKLARKYGVIKADERRIPTWEEIRKMAEDPSESYKNTAKESEANGKVLYPDKDNEIGESQ